MLACIAGTFHFPASELMKFTAADVLYWNDQVGRYSDWMRSGHGQ